MLLFSGHDRFKTELFPSVLLTCFVGVEDLEDYHGKALVDKGKAAVEKLKEGLVNDKHNVGPQLMMHLLWICHLERLSSLNHQVTKLEIR